MKKISSIITIKQIKSPLYLSVSMIAGIVVFNVIQKLVDTTGVTDLSSDTPWLISCSFTLFYAILSCIISLGASDTTKYWFQAIVGYVIVAVLGGVIAYCLSDSSPYDVQRYKQVYFVVSIAFLVLLSIVQAMRKLVIRAQKQDR